MPVRNRMQIKASWGDCDAAEIVFYPRYFDWFDRCSQTLFHSVGLGQRELRRRWGIIGTGIVDASARFAAPVTYGDSLEATSYVERWSERSFTVYHRFDLDGVLAVEGREVRLWLKRAADTAKVVAEPLPEEFKRRLGWRGDEEKSDERDTQQP